MEDKYYIAKIGYLWVSDCHHSINVLRLKKEKKYAQHLKQEEIDWIKENVPFAEIKEVKVIIEEIQI